MSGQMVPRGSPHVRNADEVDPVTAIFGSTGVVSDDVLAFGAGCIRQLTVLRRLWDELDTSCVVGDIDLYPGTQGTPELLDGFALLVRRERGLDINPCEFVATHGALDGLAHALSTLPTGSPVLFPVPGFDISAPIARANCLPYPLAWPLGASVSALVRLLEAALADLEGVSKSIVVNFPRNPSGVSATPSDWSDLLSLVEQSGALLVVDDVYGFVDMYRPCVLWESDDVVVVDSVSKRLGAPGLRLGFAHATTPRLSAVRASLARSTVGVSRPVAALGAAAIARYARDSVGSRVADEIAQRRRRFTSALDPAIAAGVVAPSVGIYVCVRTGEQESATVSRELRDAGLEVTPGEALYQPHDSIRENFVRVCIGRDDRVEEAARILSAYLMCRDSHGQKSGDEAVLQES